MRPHPGACFRLRCEFSQNLVAGFRNLVLAGHLVCFLVGIAEVVRSHRVHLRLKVRQIDFRNFARFFRATLSKIDDGVHHRLHFVVTVHNGAEHHLFGQFLGFRLHHQDRVLGAGNHQLQIGALERRITWIQQVFAIAVSDFGRADRAGKWHTRDSQRRRCTDQSRNVGVDVRIQ